MSRSRSITIVVAGLVVAGALAGGLTWAFAGGNDTKKKTANSPRPLTVAGVTANAAVAPSGDAGTQIVGQVVARSSAAPQMQGLVGNLAAASAAVPSTQTGLGGVRTAPAAPLPSTGLSAPLPAVGSSVTGITAAAVLPNVGSLQMAGTVGSLTPNLALTPSASSGNLSAPVQSSAGGAAVAPGETGPLQAP